MLNCTTDKYFTIYAPWLQQSGELLDLVGYEPGQKLLDLCGGTGAVSIAAHFRDHHLDGGWPSDITLFDLNPRIDHPGIKKVKGKAEDLAIHFPRDTFDLIVCRQAVGYLNPSLVFPAVARVLKPGGKFVFNSFIHPLEKLPREKFQPKPYSWKFYKHDGGQYVEFYYFWRGHIVHLQWRVGTGWDVTHFRFHDPQDIRRILCLAGFEVLLEEHGRGLRWTCTKPKHLEVVR
jgi:ubiquinone/menaquinone biosynthesis C-methylase UbiE